jgi:hypothetical protein
MVYDVKPLPLAIVWILLSRLFRVGTIMVLYRAAKPLISLLLTS